VTRAIIIAVVVLMVLVAGAIVWRHARPLDHGQQSHLVIDDPAMHDDLHLELAEQEPERWIRQFDPERSNPGYNLVFYRRRVPLIIDMNGRVVHSWPEVRATGRARLNPDGSLAVIGSDNLIKEYSWDGELQWFYQLDDVNDLPHHDVIRLQNGNYLILAHNDGIHTDYLLEVDRQSRVVWDWYIEEHTKSFPNWDGESTDPSHSNSIRELPWNQWYEQGDERFRPGNILVSARNLNTIFIIDRVSGDVVWTCSNGLDGQHEAVMIGPDQRRSGLIMVFNNGFENLFDYRRSSVQIINPITGKVEWEYRSEFFFSLIGGTAQPLYQQNVLITSSHSGRVFEVQPTGRIVWEWTPPYLPMRVARVPYDHCPQLADLPKPTEVEIIPEDRRPLIDADLYRFEFKRNTNKKMIDGGEKHVLTSLNCCRDLRIPVDAVVHGEFGFDGELLAGRSVKARFQLTIDDGENPRVTLIDETIDDRSDKLWVRRMVPINGYAMKEITMCVETDIQADFEIPSDVVFWATPLILSRADRERLAARNGHITEQERRLREQQLKSIGYIN
jgi:hypothetical protein